MQYSISAHSCHEVGKVFIQLPFPDCQGLLQFQRLKMTKSISSSLNGMLVSPSHCGMQQICT